ncbi:neocarzinostatin apoprotein domain-containing protein [Nocardia macrotermitis]|uniref:Neocarzinostatin family protein n=1 Tax=Nocardia macrotermitis TaxID=2585198 RepID=A0A7K0D590_9NOCA|nr:neocarzinostatin apoprotein domain-containing protein [Nocardia macrotermitis]MQY20898.1 hypothetical protein [Nocardia macrotermitis]
MKRAMLAGALALTFAAMTAAPAVADATATLHVDATTDLRDGQRITVSGSGFQPGLAAVAVGLCKQGYTNGLTDCDLDGGATFVNVGADGTFATLTLTVRDHFKSIDCLRQQCEVAAAPLPGTQPAAVISANTGLTPVTFVGSKLAPPTTAPAAGTVTAAPADTRGPSTVLWSVTAALLAVVAIVAFADRRRL